MPNIYFYARFSSEEQAKGHSEERQLGMCQDYCRMRGWKLPGEGNVFIDRGLSAYKSEHIKEGAQLHRFLKMLKDGGIPQGESYLLVENLDRLGRENVGTTLRRLMGITSEGVNVITVDDGKDVGADSILTHPAD
jgi:DNA invertase Pin-like site-specific DNA recombinase